MNSEQDKNRVYVAIDLKSFYASVECAQRGLDPLTTNLVVADSSRTEKTICLAVSPSLKAYGISGRARLFEVIQQVKEINAERLHTAVSKGLAKRGTDGNFVFSSSSFDSTALSADPSLELIYIIAPPRMQTYMDYSSKIYNIYLKYVSPEDIHVYSVDEVFIDVTNYIKLYRMSAHELAMTMIRDVLYTTGITATGGIGTNLYLAKVAMDIVAKHIEPDKDGVRIAELNEMSYRRQLWAHTPLTDFWRIGRGYEKKLNSVGLFTMGDIARCSIGKEDNYYNEGLLYRLFGVNAELLIDHAWGWEPVTIAQIKSYRPESNSLSSGQVLKKPYTFDKARLVLREMTDMLVLELVDKGLKTDQIVLTVSYDRESLSGGTSFDGEITTDHYGRSIPKHAHGSVSFDSHTSSTLLIMDRTMELYEKIVNPKLLIRRINICANHVVREELITHCQEYEQLDLFTDYTKSARSKEEEAIRLDREKSLQRAVISIKKKYGKNAILKGLSLEEDATAMERNNQIGGHKA